MNKGEITYTIKIKKRTGLFWNTVFWLVFFAVVPLQLICLWLSKELKKIATWLFELWHIGWYEQINSHE